MIDLNDVLLAMSNIPVDDPIAEIWGRGLQGGYKIIKYTGSLPITINANGDALIDYRIYGTDGGVGEPTENLFDPNAKNVDNGYIAKSVIGYPNGEISIVYWAYVTEYIPVDSNTNYIIFTDLFRSTVGLERGLAFYDENKNFISAILGYTALDKVTYESGRGRVRFTTPENCRYIRANVDSSATMLMLVAASTPPPSYIPYGYKLPIVTHSENLFDINSVTPKSLINATTGEIENYQWYDTTGIMDIENNFVFAFAKSVPDANIFIRVGFYDAQNNFISHNQLYNPMIPRNVVVPNGTKKVRLSYTNGTGGYAYPINLFIGLTVQTSYIPYSKQTIPVYIGENKLDSVEGVADYVDKVSGKIVRMIGEYTFTGDESFNKYGSSDVFYTSTTIDPVGITTVNTITMRCNHPAFTAIENKDTRYWLNPEADDICCFLPGGRSQVFLRSTSNFTTAAECEAYLKAQFDNGTPVKISYWLKTPVEEEPPVPFPEIPTVDGTTVIDYDGTPKPSLMYVKYKGKG